MTKVKICGITELRDGLKAHELGADFLGFIFFEQSPRKMDPNHARVIIEDLPKEILKVGLFLDQDIKEVAEIAKKCHLDMLQLHGNEDPKYCSELKKDFKIAKTFRIENEKSLDKVNRYKDVDFYLFDTFVTGIPGGTGKTFDWNLLIGKKFDKPFFLAGGLNPVNVGEAVSKVQPYAVDVASGVEKAPGKKDYKRVKEFIENAKKN